MKDDKRGRTRVSYSAHALVSSGEQYPIEGTIRDISMESLYLKIKPVFTLDEQVKLKIILRGTDSELIIKASALVSRIDDDGVAMRFPTPLQWWPVFTIFPLQQLDGESLTEMKE